MSAILDTHAAVWYLLDSTRLSSSTISLIDSAAAAGSPAFISAITLVEVAYLVERNRVPPKAFERFLAEINSDTPTFRVVPVDSDVASLVRQIPRPVVPDMPDRIIAATALRMNLPLVTRDARLRAAGIHTIW